MPAVAYSDAPHLTWLVEEGQWRLDQPFTARWGRYSFRLPAKFRTDLASIPRLLRWLIPQIGRHIQAAIVHDLLYRWPSVRQGLTRAQVDKMFLDAMEFLGVPLWKRQLMYAGVRAGGWASWKKPLETLK